MEIKKRKNLLIIGIITLVVVLLGSTYAFFMYSKTLRAFTLTSNSIKAEFESGSNSVNMAYAYPISDGFAKQNLDKLGYLDFTVKGSISDKKEAVTYEIYLTEDGNNTLDSNFIKVYLTDDTNNEVVTPSIYNSLPSPTLKSASDGKVILTKTETGTFESKYRIYVWIDSEYSQNEVNQTFSFKVNLYAYNDVPVIEKPNDTLKKAIASHTTESCNPSITDDDGTIYLSGTNECVDFNYVWYSGKLWRILSINPDGTMKMITEDTQSQISYNDKNLENANDFKDSWAYQWLNEDFLDTLYNYQNIIVTDTVWNYTYDDGDDNGDPTNPEKLPNQKTVSASVGLLSAYEYYMGYQHGVVGEKEDRFTDTYISIDTYLKNGDGFYTLTPSSIDKENLWIVSESSGFSDGNLNLGYYVLDRGSCIRPVVTLKNNLSIKSGNGTLNNPYKLMEDKELNLNENNKLNSRLNGEYVEFDNDVYRIIKVENNNTTKLISTKDHGRDFEHFPNIYGEGSDNTYIDYFLNNDYYNAINLKYRNMMVEGTYYISKYVNDEHDKNYSYKRAICKDSNTKETTKNCEKTTEIWNGYVGLPIVGEVFAQSMVIYINNPNLVARHEGWYSIVYASFTYHTITLSQDVIITGGDGTSLDTAFTIALPN